MSGTGFFVPGGIGGIGGSLLEVLLGAGEEDVRDFG
jgi:hypothetical protein